MDTTTRIMAKKPDKVKLYMAVFLVILLI